MSSNTLFYKVLILTYSLLFCSIIYGQNLLEVEGFTESGHIGINMFPSSNVPLTLTTPFSSMARFDSNQFSAFLEIGKNGSRTGAIWNRGTEIVLLSDAGDVSLRSIGQTFLTVQASGTTFIGGSGSTFTPSGFQNSLEVVQRNAESGIGLTQESSGNQWGFTIDEDPTAANESLNLVYNGAFKGSFSPTDGTYFASSDRRLKEKIYDTKNILSQVKLLQPKRYIYKDSKAKALGFIAQDVQDVLPELVLQSEQFDLYAVNYSAMSTVAIAAIQEQQEIIENQQKEIEDLKALLNDVSERLEKLEEK